MKRVSYLLFFLVVIGLVIFGCERDRYSSTTAPEENSTMGFHASTQNTITASSVVFPQSVVLAGFTVTYQGRVAANNQTTFTYVVSGPGVQMAFRLELPGCAPALMSWVPGNGTQNSTDATINPGIEWSPSVGSRTTRSDTFSVTYPGTIREGIVLCSVKSNSSNGVGFITGACARVFDISGSVYTDGNSNSVRDGSETGIVNVGVGLYDSINALLESKVTDGNGNYIFEAYPAGHYTVKVDTTTIVNTKTSYLSATTPLSIAVTIGPNSSGNNFGFAPKSSKLINDLKFGVLPTNGVNAGFWKKQLQNAISGGGSPAVPKDSLLLYISKIRTLLLTDPYQLGTGDGLQAAFDILNKPIKTDLDALNQALLALEFNYVSRHGITSDLPLELVIIGWGEGLVASSSALVPQATSSANTLSDATSVCNSIDKSSGGGGGSFFQ